MLGNELESSRWRHYRRAPVNHLSYSNRDSYNSYLSPRSVSSPHMSPHGRSSPHLSPRGRFSPQLYEPSEALADKMQRERRVELARQQAGKLAAYDCQKFFFDNEDGGYCILFFTGLLVIFSAVERLYIFSAVCVFRYGLS